MVGGYEIGKSAERVHRKCNDATRAELCDRLRESSCIIAICTRGQTDSGQNKNNGEGRMSCVEK